ncbi:MAG: hypothetical protein ACI9EQ_001189 [Bacteroidia bacterium]|jgi:hypothetical protein
MSEIKDEYVKRAEDFSYDIRRIGPEDFSVLIPLMQDCFGMDVDIEYFRWKFTQNPAGSFIGFVAIDGFTKEAGAYYGVIPQVFELDGVETTIYQSCDTMTHSAHRRRGLFRKLAMRTYEELENEDKFFAIGFGGGQSTPGFIKFGWQRVFDFRYYFRPALFCKFNRANAEERKQVSVSKAAAALDAGLDVSKKGNAGKAKGLRSQEQIKWRLSNPNKEYLTIRLRTDEASYIIFSISGDKMIIFDFFFKVPESGKTLIRFLNDEAASKQFKGIISFCQENSNDSKTLKSLGFINNPFSFGPLNERVPFIQFSNEENMEKYKNASDWLVTTYDHDSL